MPPPPSGVWRTDWSSLTVGQMWDMVNVPARENADWDQALAWQRISDLVDYHRSRVQTYRAKLSVSWPPHPGSASAVFMRKVDELVASMAELRDAAAANGPALMQITTSLTTARRRLAPVYERWAANEQKLAGYAGPWSAAAQPGLPTPMPSPGVSPVPAGEQDRLHAEAVSIMEDLGTTTIESRNAFQTPPPYQPPGGQPDKNDGRPWSPLGNPSEAVRPTNDLRPGAPAGRGDPAVRPVLAGTSASATAVPAPGHTGPPLESGTAAFEGPSEQSFDPPGMRTPRNGEPWHEAGRRLSTSAWSQPRGGRALPAGGVIGSSTPEALETHPVAPPESVAQNRRVNGIGGVLGGEAQAEQSGGAPFGIAGGPGARPHSARKLRFDPDTVWEVAVGVPPVLQPGPEVTVHDPGPFIGPR